MAASQTMHFNSTNIPPEVVQALPPFLQAQVPLYDENLQANLYATAAICLTLSYIAVRLRLWARKLKGQAMGWDDWMIIVALFFTSIFVAMFLFVTIMGMGRHLIVMILEHPQNAVPFAKGILAAEVFYNPATFCTKTAILLLYHRIFPSQTFKRICWGVGIFVFCYSLTALMTNIFQCVPVEADWNPALTPRCVNLDLELILVSSINVITDAVILCLPMPYVWRLHATRSKKLTLTGIFLLGSFVVVVSIIRATYVSAVSLTDGSWADSYSAMWSVVETCLAIVAACLPVLRPVFNKVMYGHVDGSTAVAGSSAKPIGGKSYGYPRGTGGGTHGASIRMKGFSVLETETGPEQ